MTSISGILTTRITARRANRRYRRRGLGVLRRIREDVGAHCRSLGAFRVFCISNHLYFKPRDKAVILSEAPHRSIANRGFMARSRRACPERSRGNPGDACWQMVLGAFRPQTTTEDKKVTTSLIYLKIRGHPLAGALRSSTENFHLAPNGAISSHIKTTILFLDIPVKRGIERLRDIGVRLGRV
jgi:hypothetical protein